MCSCRSPPRFIPSFIRPLARGTFCIPLGRLKPGETATQTHDAVLAALHDLERRFPNHLDQPQVLRPAAGWRKSAESREGRPILAFAAILGGVAALVFLVACANVAGLLLARGAARQREIAVRLAIGASRMQLVRQLLMESALVAGRGNGGGRGDHLLGGRENLLTEVVIPGMPVAFDFTPDWRLAAAAALLGIAATLLSGLMPALMSSRPRGAFPRLRARRVLAAVQVAVTVVLLSGAFLFARNLIQVLRVDPGFAVGAHRSGWTW